METETLNSKNTRYLWVFTAVNIAIFWTFLFSESFNLEDVRNLFSNLDAKDGIIAACVPIITVVLNGLISVDLKEILVFWRIKNPLPGCRAFSLLARKDLRINIDALKEKIGDFPITPEDQNRTWYQIYKKNQNRLIVYSAHQAYLLTRDLASFSLIIFIVGTIGGLIGTIDSTKLIYYVIFLILQYLVLAIAGNNYGKRFVTNVLAEEASSIAE